MKTNSLRKLLRWAPIALVVSIGFGIAFADDESDRRDLMSKIDGKLDYAANKLAGLESDSGTSDIDDALGYVREVESYVDQLARVKGDDSDAGRIVSNYPGYIRDFRTAADELKKLKDKQRDADATIKTCQAFDQEMVAKANATKDDPRGAEDLSDFAKSVGRKGEDLMKEADRKLAEVDRHRDEVKRFSASDNKWSSVRSNMHYSADAMARAHRDDYDKARSACEEVLKRERHKQVEAVLGKLANSRQGRTELRKKIDELLATLADRVKDVQSQSGTGYVNGAIEITTALESHLERLKSAAGDDEDSRRIAAAWPQWVRDLRTALESLKEMKTAQNRADEGASKCENLEKALQEKVRAYVGSPELHEKAITDLPEEADRIGTPVRDGVARAREVDSSMNDWLGRVKNFSQSEGPWAAVTSNLRDSADRVSSYWKDKFGAMTRACERLVLGRDHPDVKRAVDEMSRDTKAAGETYRGLRDEFIRWKAEVDQLRAWSDEDVEAIRQEFCNAPDADELTKVTEVANRWASQINGLYGSINGSGDRIKRAADDLIAKKRALKAAPKVKDAVDKILVSIAKLKDYQLLGSNNPLFKAQADYGVTKHADMQRSCEASEIRISGDYCDNPKPNRSDCRLDCVKRCDIVEIKPRGARALGEQQADAYVKALRKMYRLKGASMFQGEFARFEQCLSSDKQTLELEAKVDPYDFCPAKTDLAPTIEKVDVTIPSDAE